jgi:hypothetical protein
MIRLLSGEIYLYLNDLDENTGQCKDIALVRVFFLIIKLKANIFRI